MQKIILSFLIILGCSAVALSQPLIEMDDFDVDAGEAFCIPLRGSFFDGIVRMDFAVQFDPAILTYTGAQNFLFDDFSAANIDASDAANGILMINWSSPNFDCFSTGNVTPPLDENGDIMFDLCFTVNGTAIYAEQTLVEIVGPIVVERRGSITGPNQDICFNLGLQEGDPSTITIGVRPLVLDVSTETGNSGDLVCVDIDVNSGWDGLGSIQWTLAYDPAVLNVQNVIANEDIPNHTSAGNYGISPQVTEGIVTFSWAAIPGQPFPTVPDGTNQAQVCFTIVGDCETSTALNFVNAPTQIEITNEDPANPDPDLIIPFEGNSGAVQADDCDPEGIQLTVNCGAPVNINEQVCVQIQAGTNFDNVTELSYLMEWNPSILEFVTATDPNNLSALNFPGDFVTDNTDNGILGLEWDISTPLAQDLNPGEILYEVCFNVIGLGGNSPMQIVTPGIGISNGTDIGIAPTNCVVEVIQPDGVGMTFGDLDLPLGDSGCFPVTVTNFNEIVAYQFSMTWDESLWAFQNATNFNADFTNASAANITAFGSSTLFFDWDNTDPVTLPNESVLFELCFTTADGATPGACDEMMTIPLPLVEEAISASSNGENIGIITSTNEACVLFPEGFGLTAVNTTGGWLDTICMDFTVESFDNITGADFSVNWNPVDLEFVSATAIDWTGLVLDPPGTVGVLGGSFTSGTPLTIPDGSVAFEVCFQAISDPNECHPVTIDDDPAPDVQTSNGQGSMVITNGEICVEEQIVIDQITITPASCPDACDGEVSITIFEWEGQGFIGTTWEQNGMPLDFSPLTVDQVCAGELIFTIFDNSSNVLLIDTIIMPVGGSVPEVVIAGDDAVTLDCTGGLALLSVEDPDATYSYSWYFNTTTGMPLGNTSVFADDVGKWIVEVTNPQGCTAQDTVMVMAPDYPTAEIMPNNGLTCTNDTLVLQATSSSPNLLYAWTYDDGEFTPGTETSANLEVFGDGSQVQLIVTDAVTGCQNQTPIVSSVADNRIFPVACIPEESQALEQNCDGEPTEFTASCSDNPGLDVDYQWFNLDGSPSNSGLSSSFTELGTYFFVATENTTGCTDTTFAVVIENENAPSVAIAEADDFICTTESVDLVASVEPMDDNFDVVWTVVSPDGSLTVTDQLTTAALEPGIYQVQVTDPMSGCQSIAQDTVADNTTPPVVMVESDSPDNLVTCASPNILLDGSMSSQGNNFTYQWLLDDAPIMGANTDMLSVSDGGAYTLEVTNMDNFCTETMVVDVTEDTDSPVIIPEFVSYDLDCNNPEVTISVSVQNSENFDFLGWSFIDGTMGNILSYSADSLSITVDADAQYQIDIVNSDNGCPGVADIQVLDNQILPALDVTSDLLTIDCANTFATLSGAGSAQGPEFTYLWEPVVDGETPPTPTSIQTDVETGGTYQFSVTNNMNGCVSDTLVMVQADTISPTLFADAPADLTCADPFTTITLDVMDADNFTVSWTGLDGGVATPDDNAVTSVETTEDFEATVINTDNGCSETLVVSVGGDIVAPTIDLATLPAFDCTDEALMIDGSGTGDIADLTVVWTSLNPDNTVTPDAGDLNVMVDGVGDYMVEMTFNSNGCTSDSTFTVSAVDNPTVPTIVLTAPPADLGCDATPVTIDITATGDPMDFASVVWDGPGTVTPLGSDFEVQVSEAGEYMVTVVLNGALACETTEPIMVNTSPDVPVAIVDSPQSIDCNAVEVLDASASTGGDTFEWTALPGSTPLSGNVNGPTPNITGPGSYQLIYTNSANSCADTTDVFSLEQNFPDAATAGMNIDVCDDFAFLEGNAVMGTTGTWTLTNGTGATIVLPNDPGTEVSNLAVGPNTFTWTLSAPGCEEYSSAEVTISRAQQPTANEDLLELLDGLRDGSVNVLDNDILNGISNPVVTVITPPSFGTFDAALLEQGVLDYSVGPGEVGITELVYQICSRDCPDLCAEARVVINVQFGDEDPEVPNTITPNGDGSNDLFIFDILNINSPDKFPDNELVIFNRWGDIVYQAKPYTNNWAGLNQSGEELPEATYYYVLRLNISEGEIIRGDITIIR